MNIASFSLPNPVLLAPMAGITDKPFRKLCRNFGASLASSEMITANKALQFTKKTLLRADHTGENAPISVQIAGSNPKEMADAARLNVEKGAQIIDINMGCPAKKICNVLAGSALLKDEALVADILKAVVDAVSVPVTLKTRLGWCEEEQHIERISRIAEDAGIAALAIHGRTREQMYRGDARFELITKVKAAASIPIIANGDITSPQKAQVILQSTQADAVMIGRAAQGAPWIFRDVVYYLQTGKLPEALSAETIIEIILTHIQDIYAFYGEYSGCRIARKHIAWYTKSLDNSNKFRQEMYLQESTAAQFLFLQSFLQAAQQQVEKWPTNYQ